ncbi:MAG TPA: DUF4986 domain-containing protein, partial [Roseiflexaceae bacterium]|nr:DUF4986 domain-containing protein [Roseiflexaceae bacterium]
IRLGIKIRYPAWANDLRVTVNGQAHHAQAEPGAYITLEREWHNGDQIDVRLPMRLNLEALPGAPNIVAVLYGPIVLAGALGADNMPDLYLHDLYTRITPINDWPAPEVPVFVGAAEHALANIERVAGKPLTFRTNGISQPHDVELIPFSQLHHQRYTVYWQLRATDDVERA